MNVGGKKKGKGKKTFEIKGKDLNVNIGIADDFSKPILSAIEEMAKESIKEMREAFLKGKSNGFAMDEKSGNTATRAKNKIETLLKKWGARFKKIADFQTAKMISRVSKNSEATFGMAIQEFSDNLTLSTKMIDDRLKEIIDASTTEATSLIKLIPQEYLSEVQQAAMRSITSGNGIQDLIPFMKQKYKQNARHAKNVAYDQTRKAYSNMTEARMKSRGIEEFEWMHSGGSQRPRKLHKELSGKIFRFDDLPVIGTMYGQQVRGKPGDLPNCRCKMRPVFRFGDD